MRNYCFKCLVFFQVASHLRKYEVEQWYDPEDFEEYKDLCSRELEYLEVDVLRLEEPPARYQELEACGILPPWPGIILYLFYL